MKICVAQTRPVKGDIQSNIVNHKKLIELAVSNGADIVIFPELSITGYEPQLAEELATTRDDSRLDDFQNISDAERLVIGLGIPTKNNSGVNISMIIFQPHESRRIYSKKYLHQDEEAFFVSGESFTSLSVRETNIAFAICYELSIPQHSEKAWKDGAGIYIASVAKTITGVEKAISSLSGIANKYSMTVLMSNCIGECDGTACGGKSSIWNSEGVLLAQLDDSNEGILIIDTNTREVIKKTLQINTPAGT